MSNTRLSIKTIEVTPDGLLIKSMEVIDAISGERLKIAELNEKLCEFLKCVEIDIDAYFKIEKLKEKNPNITELISTFRLFT